MKDCIFCKIINNEISSRKIYEDNSLYVFLDVNSVSPGHMLIIPKKHYENIFETPKEILENIAKVSKEMSILCKEKLQATGVNVLNASGKDAQQSVFHLHYHIVPRYENDTLDLWFHGTSKFIDKIDSIYEKLTK